jgi:1-phosphofructokinase family hexose kinase
MADLLIAGPNLSLDRTIAVDELAIGRIHRTAERDSRGGGKGVNVARALKSLGDAARVVGFAAGATGNAIRTLLEREGLDVSAVAAEGESRSCLTVLAPGSITVFNEEGPGIDEGAWVRFEETVRKNFPDEGVFVCSGSWPPGAPPDAAARLVTAAKARGCFTICDTSKVQLRRALEAEPDLIKPNVAEAHAALDPGAPPEPADEGPGALDRAAVFAAGLLEMGPRAIVCSAGSHGAVLATAGSIVRFPPIDVEVVNPVGAGDCLVAGIAHRVAAGHDLLDAVKFGIGVAAASCETFPAGLLDRARALELLTAYETSKRAI